MPCILGVLKTIEITLADTFTQRFMKTTPTTLDIVIKLKTTNCASPLPSQQQHPRLAPIPTCTTPNKSPTQVPPKTSAHSWLQLTKISLLSSHTSLALCRHSLGSELALGFGQDHRKTTGGETLQFHTILTSRYMRGCEK